jgi:hypothetical protein
VRRPAYTPPARRQRGGDASAGSMRLGGYVMLALAAWQLIERFVLSQWFQLDTSLGKTFGYAVFDASLGVAMLQGSEAARKVVLVITGVATIAILAGIGTLVAGGFGHLWPMLGASAAATIGIFLLVLFRDPGIGMKVVSLALVGVGWIGSTLASIFLVGTLDFSTLKVLRAWSSPDRSFESAADGIEMQIPTRWVIMKEGSPIADAERALVTLANTEVISFAQLFTQTGSLSSADSLEYYLDQIAKPKESEPEFARHAQPDGHVGAAPARRMMTSWRHEDSLIHQHFIAWQDGDVFYHLTLWGPAILAKKLEAERARLESGIKFSAPWSAFLKGNAVQVQAACPLLSEKATIVLARAIPRDSPPEVYCREGYRLAFKGQPLLDPEGGRRLQGAMRSFFDAVPRGQIGRFGTYVERLRVDQKTSPAEDREMVSIATAAVQRLDKQVRDDLKVYFGMAIELGGFSPQF